MTDIMKLADNYARLNAQTTAPGAGDARAALQSAIEALQEENALLEGTLESRGRNIAALQAENEQFRLLAKANSEALGAALVERDALQAKLDAMGKGEPVAPEQVEAAWRAGWAACRDAEYVGQEAEDEAWGMSQTCANADWESAAPKALAPLTDEQMRDAFAQALTDVYVCTRVWSAWSYGTMTEDDFSPASECDEVLDSLVQAAHGIGGTP